LHKKRIEPRKIATIILFLLFVGTYRCANSWAMTNALVRPSSLSIAAERVLEQTPPTGAKPDGPPSSALVNHTVASHPVLSERKCLLVYVLKEIYRYIKPRSDDWRHLDLILWLKYMSRHNMQYVTKYLWLVSNILPTSIYNFCFAYRKTDSLLW
jgi:hypothetical protein